MIAAFQAQGLDFGFASFSQQQRAQTSSAQQQQQQPQLAPRNAAAAVEDVTKRVSADFAFQLDKSKKDNSIENFPQQISASCSEEATRLRDEIAQNSRILLQGQRIALEQELKDLVLERDTWNLLQKRYDYETVERKKALQRKVPLNGEKWSWSHARFVDSLFCGASADSEALRLQKLVISWLEEIYDEREGTGLPDASWKYALAVLKGEQPQPQGTKPVISELDPDAPVRQKNQKDIPKDDKSSEEYLLMLVWEAIRCGKLDKALEICRDCKQPWRAALLQGTQLYHNSMFENEKSNQGVAQGNKFRFMHLYTLLRMSDDERVNKLQRAIAGVLAGNAAATQINCQDWYDYVWSYAKALMEHRIDRSLREQGLAGTTQDAVYADDARFADNVLAAQLRSLHGISSLEEIFTSIQHSAKTEIRKESTDLFHLAQQHLISGGGVALVRALIDLVLKQNEIQPQEAKFVRFAVHMILFLRETDLFGAKQECTSENAKQVIVRYIRYLIRLKQYDRVAIYARYIDSSTAMEEYARMLVSLSDEQKKSLLNIAAAQGLNAGEIAKRVVALSILQPTTAANASIIPNFEEVTAEDRRQIEAVRWFLLSGAQNAAIEGLQQTNTLLRSFILRGKYVAARELLKDISAVYAHEGGNKDLAEHVSALQEVTKEPVEATRWHVLCTRNAVKEFNCWKVYLNAKAVHGLWLQQRGKKPLEPAPPVASAAGLQHISATEEVAYQQAFRAYKAELEQWSGQNEELVQQARAALIETLVYRQDRWLEDKYGIEDVIALLQQSPVEARPDATEVRRYLEQRAVELNSLRCQCIPEVTFLLHHLLFDNNYLFECMSLADVVADEGRRLYAYFQPNDLLRLLDRIKESEARMIDLRAHADQYHLYTPAATVNQQQINGIFENIAIQTLS